MNVSKKEPNKHQIVKATVDIYGEKLEKLVIYTAYGEFVDPYDCYKVVDWHPTRNVDCKVRNVLLEYVKGYEEAIRLDEEQKIIRQKWKDLKSLLDTYKSKYDNAKGVLSGSQFKDELLTFFTDRTLRELNDNCYEVEIRSNGIKTWLFITRDANIEKWYDGAMLRKRYDDSYYLDYSSKVAKKERNFYIKKYSCPLSEFKAPIDISLDVADKRWLVIRDEYSTELVKPLTKDYALEIANKLYGKSMKKSNQ